MNTEKYKKPITKGIVKVPVIMQMEALECGAACLAMVMAYYGKWEPLEKVRLDCGVSRDGSNAADILKAARRYGFDAQGYRCEHDYIINKIQKPAIIHWNFNHFVVLAGFRGNTAYINDPARGEVKVSSEEFDRSFTGIALEIVPSEVFEPTGKKSSILEFALRRMKGAQTAVAFVMLSTLISSLFGILNPMFSRFFIDRLLTGENIELLLPFIGLMALIAAAQIITQLVQSLTNLRIHGNLAIIGSSTYMWKILHLPMNFFSQRMAGDILQRQSTNSKIASTLVHICAPLLLNSLMMVFYLSVMFRYSVLLTLVGLGAMTLNLIISCAAAKKRVNITRAQMRDSGKLESATVSGIHMAETIKASGAENGFFQKWAGYQASLNTQSFRFAKISQYLGTLPSVLANLANCIVLILGVWLIINGRFTLGMVMTFQGFLSSFISPAQELITASRSIQEMRADMERIEDVMRYPDDPNCIDTPEKESDEYAKLSGHVELKHVTFGYAPLGRPLIEDFSLDIKPGSSVALVGTSGCGKSTISRLITGLYQPWSGEILFDGKKISETDRSVFTGSVAVVDQEITLFEDTIAANIRMWDESIEDFEVILAARDAQIYDLIMEREGGFESRLAEGGKDLSGGQRQQMEIARVLAQDPTIIILDEATSALDARTEYELVTAIRKRGITCIVIAHRLSTIRDCDEIIVLDHGKAIERGTHDELYARGGMYTELISNN